MTTTIKNTIPAKQPVEAPKVDKTSAGPNKPQLRILAALAKSKRPMTKQQLVDASGVHTNWIAEYVGTDGEMVSELVNGTGPRKLVPAKLVRFVTLDDGSKEYDITAAGRKALERSQKA